MTEVVGSGSLRSLARRSSFRSASLVIANSATVLADAIRHGEAQAERGAVVLNGIRDEAILANPPQPWTPGTVVKMITIANYGEHKGIAVAQDVAHGLARAGVAFDWAFVGANYPPDFGSHLRAPHARTYATGSTPDVMPLLDQSQLQVHPSLTEGVPNAVLEGMARGKTIVATDVGGTAEAMSGAGVLVSPGNSSEVLQAILGLLRRPELMAELSERAVTRAHQLSATAFTNRHQHLYEGIMTGSPRRDLGRR